jgi:hypothetical protein
MTETTNERREALARIIEPELWLLFDRCGHDIGHDYLDQKVSIKAAIERSLAKADAVLAHEALTSSALGNEPVAWLMRQTNGAHNYACITPCAQRYIDEGIFTKEPLYAASPALAEPYDIDSFADLHAKPVDGPALAEGVEITEETLTYLEKEARAEIDGHNEWLIENDDQPDPGADEVGVHPKTLLKLLAIARSTPTLSAPGDQGALVEWQTIETAPHACHVMAARFDECEWVMQVVASPPGYPFTHWKGLPSPPLTSDGAAS